MKNKEDIIELINNLQDKNNNKITYSYILESKYKKTKENNNFYIWFIISKEMIKRIQNNINSQFFCDTTYRCIPPTIKNYKLFIISSYDFLEKKIFICAYILIPNEKEETYTFIFDKLKKDFSFNPFIITLDHAKYISNAIKKIYPETIQVKCFFHFMQAINKNLKKYGLINKKNIKDNTELIFNIKLLCFVDPSLLEKFYKDIENEYKKNKDYKKFFEYFNRQWSPYGGKKKLKFIPPWNYYSLLNSQNFDKKHMFFTNNISESINHLLNSNFKYKYPTFSEWKKTILTVVDNYYSKEGPIQRKDYITKIMIYLCKYVLKDKKDIKLFKYQHIKKINSIILPHSDSLTISSLSELLNLDGNENNNEESLISENKDNSISSSDEEFDHDLRTEIEPNKEENNNFFNTNVDNNNNNFNDFKISIKNFINNINYSEYEKIAENVLDLEIN